MRYNIKYPRVFTMILRRKIGEEIEYTKRELDINGLREFTAGIIIGLGRAEDCVVAATNEYTERAAKYKKKFDRSIEDPVNISDLKKICLDVQDLICKTYYEGNENIYKEKFNGACWAIKTIINKLEELENGRK